MEAQPDFRDLLALFNAQEVKFIIVGGYALAFHGAPRFTGDLDIFVQPDPKMPGAFWQRLMILASGLLAYQLWILRTRIR
jgi:hypothetical protein